MNDITRCSKCVLPNTLPSVTFNSEGKCNNCIRYENILEKMDKNIDKNKKKFEKKIKWANERRRPYDCLIPLSGGKDSIYTLYLADKIFNMKCLCITFDNGFLSDHARNNITEAIRRTNADHIYYKFNQGEMMDLYRIFLERTGSFCPPCMRGIEIVSKMGAEMYKIPLIVKGSGKRYSYLSYIPELFQSGDPVFFNNVMKSSTSKMNYKPMMQFRSKFNLNRFIHLSTSVLKIHDPTTPQYISLFDYVDHSYDTIYNTIKDEMNWKEPTDQSEHMDCKASKIAIYIHSRKVKGITDQTAKNSSLIRLGLMSRSDALKYEDQYSNNVPEPKELDWFLDQINMEKNDFYSAVDDWKKIKKYRPSSNMINNSIKILKG